MRSTALALEAALPEIHLMLKGEQIRAGRALLKWSGHDLAERSGLSYAAIQRAESVNGLPNMRTHNLAAIKTALEAAGIEFLDGPYSGDGGPGVRLHKS